MSDTMTITMTNPGSTTARGLQLAERLDLKGLDRTDVFSVVPLGFHTPSGGSAVLFRSGAAVFIGLNPVEEEEIVRGLGARLINPLGEREIESLELSFDSEDAVTANGAVHLKTPDPARLLVVAEVLASAVSLSLDERRVGTAFVRVARVAEELKAGRLSTGSQREILADIGEALAIQSRLAGRVGLDDKPDVLWEHPELERLWMKLADEFDLKSRANAVAQKLAVIRDSADTLSGLLSTRTSHRLEWYIIALIAIEIVLGLYDRFWK
ncbi:MAG TPA: RMD1 family protein [Hyphomicrobium sp.]|nr:RMD1 family protein [Hyphomicrobium sp.]